MVTNQNFYESIKYLVIDNDDLLKKVTKVTKKVVPKRASFISKPQTPINSQNVNQINFAILAGQSLYIAIFNKKSSKK